MQQENTIILKSRVENNTTSLQAEIIEHSESNLGDPEYKVKIKNTGNYPSFMTTLDLEGAESPHYSSDNYFWLDEGKSRVIKIVARDPFEDENPSIKIDSWNNENPVFLKVY